MTEDRMQKRGNTAEPKVSVIVPVYNVEKYLLQCLESLHAQTYKNLEIILLNDGSSDSSGKIAELYVKKEPRIKYFYWNNIGYSETLRRGISFATGDYLAFLDSDDWAEPDFIESLLTPVIEENADFSVGSYYVYNERTKKKTLNDKSWMQPILERSEGKVFPGGENIIFDDAVLWNKLFDMRFFNSLEIQIHGDMKTAPDVPVVWCAFLSAGKIVSVKKPVVNYRIERNGQHTGARDDRFFSCFEIFRYFFEFSEGHPKMKALEPIFLHLQLSRYLWGYERTPESMRARFFDKLCSEFQKRGYDKHSFIFFPSTEKKSVPEKIRMLLLKKIHPMTLKAIAENNRIKFDRIVDFRLFLEKCFNTLLFLTGKV